MMPANTQQAAGDMQLAPFVIRLLTLSIHTSWSICTQSQGPECILPDALAALRAASSSSSSSNSVKVIVGHNRRHYNSNHIMQSTNGVCEMPLLYKHRNHRAITRQIIWQLTYSCVVLVIKYKLQWCTAVLHHYGHPLQGHSYILNYEWVRFSSEKMKAQNTCSAPIEKSVLSVKIQIKVSMNMISHII
jgi:hypothetical protein